MEVEAGKAAIKELNQEVTKRNKFDLRFIKMDLLRSRNALLRLINDN